MNVNVSCERVKHPKEVANFLSKATFFYNLGIIWKTYKSGTFKENDLCEVLSKCKADVCGDELEECLNRNAEKNIKISLNKILWKCYGVKYLILGVLQLLVRSMVIITIPISLSKVVLYFQPNQNELSKRDVIFYASLLVLLNFLSITYMHNYLLTLTELGIKIRTALCSVIFRKSLRLSSDALSNFNAGNIITLITKDVTAIETFFFYCNDTWIGVVQVAIVFYLIYAKMGMSTLIGFGFFIATVPIQILIGKITSKLRMKSSKKTDERIQATKESLFGIKVVKMNNWEDNFEETINNFRKTEMNITYKIFLAKASVFLLGSLTSKISFYLLLTSYVLLGNNISAELIYYVTTIFLRIRHALNVAIPVGVTVIADMTASLKRIEAMLVSNDISNNETYEQKAQIYFQNYSKVVNNNLEYKQKPKISLENISVILNDIIILDKINMNIDSNLIIITGPIGSGKSTLLKTILGEIKLEKGIIYKKGIISYASQEPWIFHSTLKQNIVFGEEFEEDRYQVVLDKCALNFDFQNNSSGDNMIIGDNGKNLSKGQKARIALARAVYKKADIYLLDDSLTCLDTHIQEYVFEKCIKEFLANKVCIYVTQNPKHIEEGDEIVTLDKGQIIFNQSKSCDKKTSREFLSTQKKYEELSSVTSDEENLSENILEESTLLKSTLEKKENKYEEINKSGKVEFEIYKKYCHYGGGIILVIIILCFLGTQFSKRYTEKILGNWVNIVHQNSTHNKEKSIKEHVADLSLVVYTIFTISTILLAIISAFILFNFSRKASVKLHKSMLKSVLHASLTFYDKNLIGNILNRFSKDLNIVDEQIPSALYEFLEIFFDLCGIVILITSINIIFLVPTIIFFVFLYCLRKVYIPIGRNLQRIDTSTRSPIIGYISASLEGLTTIRTHSAEKLLAKEFDRHQDLNTSANFMSKCCERTLGYYLDICCTAFIAVIIGIFIIFDKTTSVGNVGLVITQAFMLTGIFQYGIRKWTEIENKMTSVERILDYTNIEQESGEDSPNFTGWPKDVDIKFTNISFSYGGDENYVLKDINLTIGTNEKIGIVGRTGSGKSTLVSLLFRLYPYEGNISLGGVDLRNIPLKILRSNISIITQDPILFTGTIRTNLDPKNQNTDESIWKVLSKVQLQNLIPSLDLAVSETVSHFSSGQKQLICLARCLLDKNKIMIFDEASSDMDQDQEDQISKIIEEHFRDCTVIIIAHRLKTVSNCDRVIVIEKGQIIENDKVENLKSNFNSIFYGLLKKSGFV